MNLKIAGLLVASALATVAMAKPIVTESVSGVSGAYTLDFTFTNNLPGNFDLYFMGVYDPNGTISGYPTNYGNDGTWNMSVYGGSNTTYTNTWFDGTYSSLTPGNSLGGFDVFDTSAVAPTNVQWFAFGYDPTGGSVYNGGDNFWTNTNPGFEGNVTPEPMPLLAMGAGLLGLALRRRRK